MAAYGVFYSIVLWISIILHEFCVAFTAQRCVTVPPLPPYDCVRRIAALADHGTHFLLN
jgi:hypothetical protein